MFTLHVSGALYTHHQEYNFSTVFTATVQTIVSSELLAPSVAWYKIVLLMMGVYGTRNMQSERSSEIKLTVYSCICWLFHRIA